MKCKLQVRDDYNNIVSTIEKDDMPATFISRRIVQSEINEALIKGRLVMLTSTFEPASVAGPEVSTVNAKLGIKTEI